MFIKAMGWMERAGIDSSASLPPSGEEAGLTLMAGVERESKINTGI
jgi:hypothetical protein